MARPRVFVSSTFYDLQHVRNDLEAFIQDIGYEPVLFERGHVPWSQDKRLEDRCYAEIARCDILVSILGDKFGSAAADGDGSISWKELQTALGLGKQVYVFLLQSVDNAHRMYGLNKERADQPEYGMDIRILQAVDEIRRLPTTGIVQFTAARQITEYLREQWAGLFQDLLANRQQVEQQAVLNRVGDLAKTMEAALDKLSKDRWHALILNHPGIEQVRQLMRLDYRAYVTSKDEFRDWMGSMGLLVEGGPDKDGFLLFSSGACTVKIRDKAFFGKSGALNFPPKTWDESAVVVEWKDPAPPSDEDIPF